MPLAMIATKPVHIIGDRGEVNQPSVHLSLSSDEEVTWFAHGNQAAKIDFSCEQGSPFQDSVFQVPAGGSISSGRIKHGANKQSYRYKVVGPNGTNDPEVIIDP